MQSRSIRRSGQPFVQCIVECEVLTGTRPPDNARECPEFRLRLRCTCPLHQPGIADSMICQAIQPANSKSPRKTKKHPTTPTVLLSCQFLTSPSRSRQQEGLQQARHRTLAASLARLRMAGGDPQHSNYLSERDVPALETTLSRTFLLAKKPCPCALARG
jgi:hypothetical protein